MGRMRGSDSASPAPRLIPFSALSDKPPKLKEQNAVEPPQKRQRVNNTADNTSHSQPQNVVSEVGTRTGMGSEPIKCQTCNKIFTLEVDLLLTKPMQRIADDARLFVI